MTDRFKDFKFYMMLPADSTLFVTALISAYMLLFELPVTGEHVRQMMALAPVIVPTEVAVFGK
ncbi:MAG: hypothetical protein M1398_07860 [Deltaproteobacteria bacterium]|jgi:hypothetical protein|nr:hypothetical protein [Deltaproteobacteria bacterium]MDA8306864.1 hypothetical protein [Deltaproteobacteria bacterium]